MSIYQVRIRADVREKASKHDRGGRDEVYIRVNVEALDAEHAAQKVSAAIADFLDGPVLGPTGDE